MLYANMRPETTVLVDLDGVCALYDEAAQRLIADELGLDIVTKRSFHVEDDYPAKYRDAIKELTRRPGFIVGLEMEPGTLGAFDFMFGVDLHPVICTTAPKHNPLAASEKRTWVEDNLVPTFGSGLLETMIITADKASHTGIALIEDRPVMPGADDASWTHVIFDRTWNEDAEGLRIPRWSDLDMLLAALRVCREAYNKSES